MQCWNDFAFIEAQQETVFKSYYEHPALQLPDSLVNTSANYLRYEHYHSDKEQVTNLIQFVLSLIATNYLFNWYYRVKPEKVRCQEHIPIILQSEDVEDHLLEKVKSSQETPKNEQVCIDS